MMEYGSPTVPQLRHSTDELSPVGDINWKTSSPASIDNTYVESSESSSRDDPDFLCTMSDSESIADPNSLLFVRYGLLDTPTFLRALTADTGDWTGRKSFDFLVFENRRSSTFYISEVLGIEDAEKVSKDVRQLFSLATFIDLEPGMTNEFSEGLENVIEHYGDKALYVIEELVLGNDVKSSIAMEALQYVGNTDSDKWHDERRRTVERCLLKSPSVWVRDGAGLGLASLDDPKSIPTLEKAILNENSVALKQDLTLVLHQLQDTLLE